MDDFLEINEYGINTLNMSSVYNLYKKLIKKELLQEEYDEIIKECEDFACRNPGLATAFANVNGANIKRCQESACKNPREAYYFALFVNGADIQYCQKYACKDPKYAYKFAEKINNANLEYCKNSCKGTEYEGKINNLIISKIIE